MRVRLRPKYSDEEFAKIYDHAYDHARWDEHKTRVEWTIRRLNHFIELTRPHIVKVVDLSCGDGVILNGIKNPMEKVYGDIVNAPHLTIGAIAAETSVKYIQGDLLICSETLEHLDDPDTFLRDAFENFRYVAITTPLGESDPHKNWEHYWGWDQTGIDKMLRAASWYPLVEETLPLDFYTYQFWIAKAF